jgi:DNA-binding transcriptional LysR family regulator
MSMVPQDMGLEFLPFLNNPIVAVAPLDHPLSLQGPLRLQDLEPYTLLVREQGSGTRMACEEYFKEKRVHFTQTVEVSSAEAQRECVSAGLGVALLTRHAVNLELASGGLKELPVEELPLYRSWCLVQAKAKRLSPVAHAFLGFIRSERAQISVLAERFAGQPRVPANAAPGSH